jgi:hypothetical protein
VTRWRNPLLLLVLIVCAVSWWLYGRQDGATVAEQAREPARRAPTAVDAPTGPLPRNVHLVVMNGTGEAGLARRAGRSLPPLGCVVVGLADAPHDTFTTSLLVNRRLDDADARRLAAALGGVPVVWEWDARCAEDAVLVLGHDSDRVLAAVAAAGR